MGYFIEETLKVYGCAPLKPFSHYVLNVLNGLVLAFTSAIAKVGFREIGIEYLCKYQVDALAHDPIHY